MFTLIAALGRSNEIGKDNHLIWNLKEDLAFFKETTMGHKIIMGRKTFESMGKPLPGRENIVLTHDGTGLPEDVAVVNSFAEVMQKYGNLDEEIFVIGGADIYYQFKSYAGRMYLTHINEIFYNADAFFPKVTEADWNVKVLKTFTEDGHPATIKQYDRK